MNQDASKDSSEEINEEMLKNAALTFSLEGISRDLKNFLNKKVYYNTNSLKCLADIIESITQSNSKSIKEALLNKSSLTIQMYQHIFDEMRVTNLTLNFIIQKSLEREKNIMSDK